MPIVSSSMTERLRDDLDTFADEHDYSGRSDVIREAASRYSKSTESQTTRIGRY